MKKILNFMTGIMFVLFWLSLMSIDSPSLVPLVVCLVSAGWLTVAAKMYGLIYKPWGDEADV